MAGLASHLYYTEPSNFAFVFLLKEGLAPPVIATLFFCLSYKIGIFHTVCEGFQHRSENEKLAVFDKLLLILSHLFGRRYLHGSARHFYQHIGKCPSKVILEDVPPEVSDILQQYNRQTLEGMLLPRHYYFACFHYWGFFCPSHW